MNIIENSEMFAQILNNYKREKKHCGTNMLMMQDEINDLIDAGNLYYSFIEDILWLFVKYDDFYLAYFFVAKGEKLKLVPQDCDVIVELIGNTVKYNSQWEAALLEAGFEKYNKNIEFVAKKEECQSVIEKQKEKISSFVDSIGYYRRRAQKIDYDEMYQLWRSKIDKYAVHTMTEKEKDEMEKCGSGYLICNEKNDICAVGYCPKTFKTAVMRYIVSTYKGLGSVVAYEQVASMYQEGCDRVIIWIWENNIDSLKLWRWIAVETGKFSQQFLMKKALDF